MKNKFIKALIFLVFYCLLTVIVYSDIIRLPDQSFSGYMKNVTTRMKFEKGYLKKVPAEKKNVKAAITDKKYQYSIKFKPDSDKLKLLVHKDDFVKKGQKIALITSKTDGKVKEIISPISAYVTDEETGEHGSALPMESEFLASFIVEKKDVIYVKEGKIVDVILSKKPEIKIQGYLLVNYIYDKSSAIIKNDTNLFSSQGVLCYVAPLNPLSKEEKAIINSGINSVDVVLTPSSDGICLVLNEFIYEYLGKKFVIYESKVYDNKKFLGNQYHRCQIITGISDGKFTEVLYPEIFKYDLVIFSDDERKESVLKKGSSPLPR